MDHISSTECARKIPFFNLVYLLLSVRGFVHVSGFQRPEDCIESPGVGVKGG